MMVKLDGKNQTQKNIVQRTIQGLIWSATSKFSIQGFQFIVTIILARLLLPEDFGLVGMASIFVGIISIVNEMGFSAAIIQRKDLEDNHLYSSFWGGMGIGVILFIVAYFVSPLVAEFFNNELVAPIIVVSSVSFLISPLGIVHRSLLTKSLDFKKLAVTEIIASVISGIAAIIFAFGGFGVWSLVLRGVLDSIITVMLLWAVKPWIPLFYFSKAHFYDLFRFGVNVTGSSFFNYLRQNVDYIVIGRLMGAEPLGYYTLAYTLALYPAKVIAPILTRVLFPAFSAIQDNTSLLKKGYSKVVLYLSIITIPALTGIFLITPEFITVIYGDKWTSAILPLQILCFAGMLSSLGHTVGSVFYARGRPDIELKLNIVKLPITTIAVLIGSMYYIVGVAVAVLITTGAYFLITQKFANSLIELTWKEYSLLLKPAVFGSVIMAIAIYISRVALKNSDYSNKYGIMVGLILAGTSVYFFVLTKQKPELIKETMDMIKSI